MLSKAALPSVTSDQASSQLLKSQHTAVSELHARVSEKEGRCPAEPSVLQTETPSQFQSYKKKGATKAGSNEFLLEATEEGYIKTLPVDAETYTQLFAHEVQQETQLIDGNTEGCTMAVHSDVEASGDTELLPDDVDVNGGCEEVESGFTTSDIKLQDGRNHFLPSTSIVGMSEVGSGVMQHVSSNEEARQRNDVMKSGANLGITTGIVSIKLSNGDFNTAKKCEESLDSDATTEEGEAEDAGNSETVSQSRPHDEHIHIEGCRHNSALLVNKPGDETHGFCGQCGLKGNCGQPSAQNQREIFSELKENSEKMQGSKPEQLLAANKEEGRGISSHCASQMGKGNSDNSPQKAVENIHAVKGGQSMNVNKQGALPSGFVSASTNLSYLESQEPGEESQLNALNMVDKLVWMNATGMSQDSGLNIAPQSPCVKGFQIAKGVQYLAHTSEVKDRQAKMGVYNWVDSQQDEDGVISDIKELSRPSRIQRKQRGSPKLIKDRKSQTGSEQHSVKSGLQAANMRDLRVSQKKVTPGSVMGQLIASNIKSASDAEHVVNRTTEPETLLTVQARSRSRVGSVETRKAANVPSVKDIPLKNREQKKPIKKSKEKNELASSIGTHHTMAGNEEQLELQLLVQNRHERKVESCREPDIGSDTQVAIEAIDMMRHDLLVQQFPAEKRAKNRKSDKHDANKRNNVKETKLRNKSASKDGPEQEMRHQTRSKIAKSMSLPQCEGKKQASRLCNFEEEHGCNTKNELDARKEESVKKIPKTRTKVSDLKVGLASKGTHKLHGAKSVTNNDPAHKKSKSGLNLPRGQEDTTSFASKQSTEAKLNVVALDEPSVSKVESNIKKRHRTKRELTMNLRQVDVVKEVDVGLKATLNSSASIDEQGPVSGVPINPQGCRKRSKRKRESDSLGSPELQIQEHLPTLICDISSQSISRRTRSIGRNMLLTEGQETTSGSRECQRHAVGSTPDGKETVVNMGRSRASQLNDVDNDKHVAIPATVTANAKKTKLVRQEKKRAGLEIFTQSSFWPILEEGRRRKREPGCIRVLFSHSLPEDTTKHQKKILAKLGGHFAMSAADCTHFVIDSFVRTRNMLESIAAGKAVVTSQWLESCGQVHFFVDEKNHILHDAKKEKELGFSMRSSLAAAQRKPILKGMKVLVSSNTVPDFESMKAIIEAAGGKAVENMSSFSKVDATNNDTVSIVVASEKDYEFCLPFLEKGFKAYSTELILSGIVSQNLDFSRNQLFDRYGKHRQSL